MIVYNESRQKKFIKQYFIFLKSASFFQYAFLFQALYLILIIILGIFAAPEPNQINNIISLDFSAFYQASQFIFEKLDHLYDPELYNVPFRYLPLFPIIFRFYSFIPYRLAYIIHNLFMILVHNLSCFLIYYLSRNYYNLNLNSKLFKKIFFLALMAPIQVPNLILGQISELFIFFVLLSLILIESDKKESSNLKNLLFGIFIAISFIIKPIGIMLFPFILAVSYREGKLDWILILKKTFLRLIGTIIPIGLNLFFFFKSKNLWENFVKINLKSNFPLYPSTSITSIITALFHLKNTFLLTIFLAVILYLIFFTIYIIRPEKSNYSVLFGISFVIFLITYTDAWFLHVLIMFMTVLPGLMKIVDAKSNEKKPRHYRIYRVLIEYSMIYFWTGVGMSVLFNIQDFILPIVLIIFYIKLVMDYWDIC